MQFHQQSIQSLVRLLFKGAGEAVSLADSKTCRYLPHDTGFEALKITVLRGSWSLVPGFRDALKTGSMWPSQSLCKQALKTTMKINPSCNVDLGCWG